MTTAILAPVEYNAKSVDGRVEFNVRRTVGQMFDVKFVDLSLAIDDLITASTESEALRMATEAQRSACLLERTALCGSTASRTAAGT